MTDAYRCDECDGFEEGSATLTLTMKIEGDGSGFLGDLFGIGNGPKGTFDFCSLTCAESFNFDTVRQDLISEIDDKQELLDAEAKTVESTPDPTEGFDDE